jgi:hypothetical protein
MESNQRLQDEKRRGAFDADLAGGNRPRARALDPPVEITVDEIVPGAARAAHDEGADEEQQHVPGIHRSPGVLGGETGRPPAGQQQQPGADWAIEAGEPQIWPQPRGRTAVDPVSG